MMGKTWAILCTGPSMSKEVAESIRGKADKVIAVSDAFYLAPWADYLISSDAAWWQVHKKAFDFAGEKFSCGKVEGIGYLPADQGINSGLVALRFACNNGAGRVYLYGLDLAGDHYFGKHPAPLKNPSDDVFARFIAQFEGYRVPDGCKVFNATKNSALRRFQYGVL